MTARPICLLLAIGVVVLAGCSARSGWGDVRGEVTLDGTPLADGVIRFVSVDGKAGTASALIANGTFRERVPPGDYRVEISSAQPPKEASPSGRMKRGTVDDEVAFEDRIPGRYNSQSELTAKVQGGTNQVRFELKSR